MVSNKNGDSPIKINQDMNIYSLELDEANEISFSLDNGRQAYLVLAEGKVIINGVELNGKDGLEIAEENIHLVSKQQAHVILLELKKSNTELY